MAFRVGLPTVVEIVETRSDAGSRVAQLVDWAGPAKNGPGGGGRPYVCVGWEEGYVVRRRQSLSETLFTGFGNTESVIERVGPRALRVTTRVKSLVALQFWAGLGGGLTAAVFFTLKVGVGGLGLLAGGVVIGVILGFVLGGSVTVEGQVLRRALREDNS